MAVTLAVGIMLWAWENARSKKHGNTLHHHAAQPDGNDAEDRTPAADGKSDRISGEDVKQPPAVCCGLHAICEKTGMVNEPPIYYDDEELDRFAGRDAEDYSDEEIEEFRDVLLTLLPSDAPGWAVSLERRHIALPAELQPELELLLLDNAQQ